MEGTHHCLIKFDLFSLELLIRVKCMTLEIISLCRFELSFHHSTLLYIIFDEILDRRLLKISLYDIKMRFMMESLTSLSKKNNLVELKVCEIYQRLSDKSMKGIS